MSSQVKKLRVFVASPGDVIEERTLLQRVVDELNRGIATEKNYNLELIRWETHAWPSIGADAQDVINRQIPLPDIFIGILWKRFGSPTKRAESGTEEEFDRAYESWLEQKTPEIMFYFGRMPYFPSSTDDIAQLEKVLRFKIKLQDSGLLYWEYHSREQFEADVRSHLTKVIMQLPRYSIAQADLGSARSFLRHAEDFKALVKELESPNYQPSGILSVLYFDLDDFGKFNEAHGMAAGDEFLEKATESLCLAIAHKGTLFKISGDEFVAVLPNYDEGEALATAERMRQTIENTEPCLVTVSIGVGTTQSTRNANAKSLLDMARSGIVQAKSNGKNRISRGLSHLLNDLDRYQFLS